MREIGLVEINAKVVQTDLMAAPQRSILDFARPNREGAAPNIVHPPIATNNFEIKPNFIQIVHPMC